MTVDDAVNPANATCDKSVMLVQDVGASWGNGGWFTSNDSAKMNIDTWSNQKLWASAGTDASPRQCRAALRKSLTAHDGLSDPAISEEGRRMDANLLCQLSDQQIVDLFKVARAAAMPKYHNGDGSFTAAMDCNSQGTKASERIKMRPLFAPTGEGIGLTYLDRNNTEATVLRCVGAK